MNLNSLLILSEIFTKKCYLIIKKIDFTILFPYIFFDRHNISQFQLSFIFFAYSLF